MTRPGLLGTWLQRSCYYSLFSLAFLGVPVLQCVIKLNLETRRIEKFANIGGLGCSKVFYGF